MASGVISNIWRDGITRPDGTIDPAPQVTARFRGDPTSPDPDRRQPYELLCTFSGDPPPLMSRAQFTDEKTPHLDRLTDVYVEEVLNEHFTRCPTTAAGATTIGCDTPWVCSISTGGSISQGGFTLGDAHMLVTGAASRVTLIRKDDLAFDMSSADAIWMTWRAISSVSFVNLTIIMGLANNALSDRAAIVTSGGSNWTVHAVKDSSQTDAVSSTALAAAYSTFDLLLVPGSYLAGWVDGDGPYVCTSNIPTAGDSMEPFFYVSTGDVNTKNLAIDNVTVNALTGTLAHPTEDPLFALVA